MIRGERKKILFVIPSFVGGGAERILVNILKYIDKKKFEAKVVVFNVGNDYPDEIPADVEIKHLYKKRNWDFFKLIFRLAGTIRAERPDAIVSFLNYTNYLTILSVKLAGLKLPVIISEHTLLDKSLYYSRFANIKKILTRLLYKKATLVLTVSKGIRDSLCDKYGVPENICRFIYNSCDLNAIRIKSKEPAACSWFEENIPIVITSGRLTRQKNYPLLLNSFAVVLKRIKARLVILGKGEDEAHLKTYAKKLGISNDVLFLGFKQNPFKYIAKADLFVLSSSWESFGNVIIEAMACGVPVISTRCPHGPGEIINNGVNGLLVPVGDTDALAEAMSKLLNNESLRKRLADAGKKRAEDFRVEKMVAEYEAAFEDVLRL